MNLTNEFDPIKEWAHEKEIYKKGSLETQTLKLGEEHGELCKAIIENKPEEIKDAIGDMVVVLTSVAMFAGFSIEECINSAYAEIKGRTGQMVGQTFVRDKK